MRTLNSNSLTSTNTESSAATSTTTIAAASGKNYQIIGFDGCSSDQPFKVELKFGSTTKLTMQGSADTTVGRDFGDDGPVVGQNTAVSVVTTPAASGNCTANLIYKITTI
jgi:hypothetical protein